MYGDETTFDEHSQYHLDCGTGRAKSHSRSVVPNLFLPLQRRKRQSKAKTLMAILERDTLFFSSVLNVAPHLLVSVYRTSLTKPT